MTHNFNLADFEKSKVEDAIHAIIYIANHTDGKFMHLPVGILELIYGVEKAKEIQTFLEKAGYPDDEDPESVIKEFDDGEFLKTHAHIKEIRDLFTKE